MDYEDLDTARWRALAERIKSQRRVRYGSKSAAYRSAGLNSGTWDRLEGGEPVREDRLIAATKALWPDLNGEWARLLEDAAEATGGPIFGGSYSDPHYLAKVEGWLLEVDQRLEAIEQRLEKEEGSTTDGSTNQAPEAQKTGDRPVTDDKKAGTGDGKPPAEKTPDEPVTAVEPKRSDYTTAARSEKSTGRARGKAETEEMIRPDDEGPEFGA